MDISESRTHGEKANSYRHFKHRTRSPLIISFLRSR